MFTKDNEDESTCYDQCAVNWPPLVSDGNAQAGEGVDASLIGTTTRDDGTAQVTYNGYPLYYYVEDQAPGDVSGLGVNDAWYVLCPAGEMVCGDTAQVCQAPR